MKKLNFNYRINFWSVILTALLFVFASCEVGLGAAVDTQAPELDFAANTIGTGAAVRDSFMVFGNWTDDGTIKEVTATLTSTSGGSVSYQGQGNFTTDESGKGTWNVVFDPFELGIKDGSYELAVSMTDNGKHNTKITRAIIIDNTPPVVVLTRPSTKSGATTFDSYGQKFTLEGKAADDNDVKLIEVNVYADSSCSGAPLKTIQLPSVPLTIEQDVAEYSDKVVNDYSQIYGKFTTGGLTDRTGGTENRYCTLSIYDDTQRYPADGSEQTEEDKKGNVTHTYYVNDDEIATLFTEYKITELYHILNGSFDSAAGRSITTSAAESVLAQQAVTKSQFSINPENSPTFVVNSRSPLEAGENLDEAKFQITSGLSTLQIEFSAGLDKHAIRKDTIGIYVRECNNLGVVADSASKIWLVRPVPIEGETNPDAQTGAHDADKVEIVQSGTTYKFTTAGTLTPVNFPGMDVNKYYKVFVVGKDVMKNNILPKDNAVYGFSLKPDTQLINLSVTDITPDWLSTNSAAKDTSKEYKAKITFSGGDAESYTVYRKFDNGQYVDLGVQTSPFYDTFKTIDETNHPGETWAPIVITYQVKGNNDSISSELPLSERQYDNTIPAAPVLPADGIPGIIDTEQTTITFKGTASDTGSGVKEVYVRIIDENHPNKQTSPIKASYSGGEWLCQIKPSDYAGTNGAFEDEGFKRVLVEAVDGVGLKKSVTVDTANKVNGKSFIYDSASPKIALTNYQLYKDTTNNTTTWESPEDLVNNDSLIVGKLFKINGTIIEKYGLASTDGFTIEQRYKVFGADEDATPQTKKININVTNAANPANPKTWTVQLPFKSDGTAYDNETITGTSHPADGNYEYVIKAKDKAGKEDNNGIHFTVVLNTKGPAITVTSPKFTNEKVTENWQKTRDIMVSGKASSPATITGIYWTTDGTKTTGGTWSGWTMAEGSNNWNFTVSYDTDKADHKLYIAAIDELDNITPMEEYTLKVDATNPTVSPKFFQLAGGAIQQATDTIYVSGIAANKKDLTVYGTYNGSVSGYYQGTDHDTLEFKINNGLVVSKGTNKKVDITYSDGDVTTATNPASLSFTATPTASTQSWKAVFDKSVLTNG
ncbi:MAG: hypothetical protein K5907_00380, partial [Treponema sp.]|nr:hypothetical protein [Treponema sp.]